MPQGEAYTSVTDTYRGTTAKIISGVNGSTSADFDGRHFIKTVDTGWTDRGCDTISDVFSLWGMADLYAANTDTYTLSMSYDPKKAVDVDHISHGIVIGLETKDLNGKWVKAVDKNIGGKEKFVIGPWNKAYGLGTYGVDPKTHTAWAVINYTGDFAIRRQHDHRHSSPEHSEHLSHQ